ISATGSRIVRAVSRPSRSWRKTMRTRAMSMTQSVVVMSSILLRVPPLPPQPTGVTGVEPRLIRRAESTAALAGRDAEAPALGRAVLVADRRVRRADLHGPRPGGEGAVADR